MSIPQSNDSTVCGDHDSDHDSDHSDHDSNHSDHELALFINLLCNSSHTLSMKLLFCDYLMLFLPHCDLICFIMNKACLDFNPFQHYPVLQTNFSLFQGNIKVIKNVMIRWNKRIVMYFLTRHDLLSGTTGSVTRCQEGDKQ